MSEKASKFSFGRRSKRIHRLLIGGLVLTIALPSFALTWYAGKSAREARIQQALANNRYRARAGASLLNAEYGREIDSLRAIASAVNLRVIDNSAAARILNRVSENLHGLQSAAVYSGDGRLIKAIYSGQQVIQPAPVKEWFGTTPGLQRPAPVYVLHSINGGPEKTIALVVPLGRSVNAGCLLVAWKDQFARWLKTSMEGTGLYVFNSAGLKIASNSEAGIGNEALIINPPKNLINPRQAGSSIEQGAPGVGELVVGYAFAENAECTVVVVQSRSAVLAGTDRMVALFWGVFAAMLLFGTLTAWKLASAFDQQAAMARQLEEQNTQLIEAERDRSDILANISHNLRTPLASLHVTVASLLETPPNEGIEHIRDKIWSAYEDVELVDAGVRNMLEMSRIEEIFLTNKEPADLTDIVSAALARLKPRLQGWKVNLDFPPYPLIIDCDQSRIETAIVNLLENALKYAPPASQLSMSGMARDGYALFTLTDEGPGVKPGEEELVFDKFYRSPSNTTKGGTGLGLAICKAILKRHNGRIGVKPGIEGGAEFWFSLPLFYYESKGF